MIAGSPGATSAGCVSRLGPAKSGVPRQPFDARSPCQIRTCELHVIRRNCDAKRYAPIHEEPACSPCVNVNSAASCARSPRADAVAFPDETMRASIARIHCRRRVHQLARPRFPPPRRANGNAFYRRRIANVYPLIAAAFGFLERSVYTMRERRAYAVPSIQRVGDGGITPLDVSCVMWIILIDVDAMRINTSRGGCVATCTREKLRFTLIRRRGCLLCFWHCVGIL